MAEEHRCQAPEGHRLCANNCGFFGSPATMNLCTKCYGDYCLKEQQKASIKSSLSPPSPSLSSPPLPALDSQPPPPLSLSSPEPQAPAAAAAAVVVNAPAPADQQPPPAQTNRCSVCRKKVGLTGFKCRCGTTFCGTHRYPEKHDCSFDFKKVGREEIARNNPVVIAQKLEKI